MARRDPAANTATFLSLQKWAVRPPALSRLPLLLTTCATANKPRGLQAARKLRDSRRENRWVRS